MARLSELENREKIYIYILYNLIQNEKISSEKAVIVHSYFDFKTNHFYKKLIEDNYIKNENEFITLEQDVINQIEDFRNSVHEIKLSEDTNSFLNHYRNEDCNIKNELKKPTSTTEAILSLIKLDYIHIDFDGSIIVTK